MRIFITLLFTLGSLALVGQELNLKIQVNTPKQAQLHADPKTFQTLENQITEFMNSQQWTDVRFKSNEQISGAMTLTLKKQTGTLYEAELLIQTTRPVYGTDYETQVFYWIDKDITFSYQEFQPIRKTTSSFYDNLSSILSYYAYMIIGMDFDTFSELGGDPYFRIAESIVTAVPSSSTGGGWANDAGKHNRYSLVKDVFNPNILKARKAYYKYHRKGLDIMAAEPEVGRSNITSALHSIQAANDAEPTSTYIFLIINAKVDELVSIYNVADPMEKKRIYALLVDINPSISSRVKVLK